MIKNYRLCRFKSQIQIDLERLNDCALINTLTLNLDKFVHFSSPKSVMKQKFGDFVIGKANSQSDLYLTLTSELRWSILAHDGLCYPQLRLDRYVTVENEINVQRRLIMWTMPYIQLTIEVCSFRGLALFPRFLRLPCSWPIFSV